MLKHINVFQKMSGGVGSRDVAVGCLFVSNFLKIYVRYVRVGPRRDRVFSRQYSLETTLFSCRISPDIIV